MPGEQADHQPRRNRISAVAIAVAGTILAVVFTGNMATAGWTAQQTAEFREAAAIGGLVLAAVAAALVGWGFPPVPRSGPRVIAPVRAARVDPPRRRPGTSSKPPTS